MGVSIESRFKCFKDLVFMVQSRVQSGLYLKPIQPAFSGYLMNSLYVLKQVSRIWD